ncbi:MAG TPA: aldose 1-epimerase family protein [Tepidisphaeraceae bacterium]|nr:aldose 1-epimerase family protein [Tepidisphaeraceae bacterium]
MPYTQTLISSSRNINMPAWRVTSGDVTPDCPVNWSIGKSALRGGKQDGVDIIVIDNGAMQITLCPTRGMGILHAELGDVRLGWDSPVKEVVHPRHINLQSRGGLGWLEGFNEFIVRCGLESNGHPGVDRFVNNVGDEATMELTLHGKIQNIPASEVEVLVERQAPYRIHVRGRIDERMFFGPKFELWTDVSTEPGSDTFTVTDTLTNHGGAEQEFQLLYHINFGRPILEEGATFAATTERVTPLNANAAKGIGSYTEYRGPELGFVEQVYCLTPLADRDGTAIALIRNRGKDRAVSVSYSTAELPKLTLWKNTNAVEEGYVTGIEPGTGFPYNRRIERKAGRVPKLAAGASRSFSIKIQVHAGASDVKAAADRVAAVQGTHVPVVDERAPEVE